MQTKALETHMCTHTQITHLLTHTYKTEPIPSMVTEVGLSLESFGPFTFSSCHRGKFC